MDRAMDCEFEWDDTKAASNQQKHHVDFIDAMSIFSDPLALTRYDDEHSTTEDRRWVTLGSSVKGQLLVVVHTFTETSPTSAVVRVISARRATRRERVQYEEG